MHHSHNIELMMRKDFLFLFLLFFLSLFFQLTTCPSPLSSTVFFMMHRACVVGVIQLPVASQAGKARECDQHEEINGDSPSYENLDARTTT